MDYKIIYYYYNNGFACYYVEHDDKDSKFKQIDLMELNKPENRFHSYGLFETYEKNHKNLIKFKEDMITWTDEIKSVKIKTKSKKFYNLDYYKYYHHNDAVYLQFKSKNKKESLESIDKVNKTEFFIHERCRNSGLVILNDIYKNVKTECYGYDYTRFYTNELLVMKIPTKQGTIKIFNKDEIEYGKT
jgi:hypothetical protein